MNELIRVEDVEKYYGNKTNITKAVNRISFQVQKGEFVGIMGASGSGKTTLINLLDTLTMEENISLALSLCRGSRTQLKQRTASLMKTLGIEQIKHKFPYEVSGGQKQRCACARALVNNPQIVFADEPTGALDSKSARMLLETFTKMNRELLATVLMVTHDAFSASYCGRILFLQDGEIFHELIRGDKSRREYDNRLVFFCHWHCAGDILTAGND